MTELESHLLTHMLPTTRQVSDEVSDKGRPKACLSPAIAGRAFLDELREQRGFSGLPSQGLQSGRGGLAHPGIFIRQHRDQGLDAAGIADAPQRLGCSL